MVHYEVSHLSLMVPRVEVIITHILSDIMLLSFAERVPSDCGQTVCDINKSFREKLEGLLGTNKMCNGLGCCRSIQVDVEEMLMLQLAPYPH